MILRKGMRVKDKKDGDSFIVVTDGGRTKLYNPKTYRVFPPPRVPSDHLVFDYDAAASDKKLRHAEQYTMGLDKLTNLYFDIEQTKEKGENTMNINGTVAKVYKDINEIVLVTKHLGHEYNEDSHKDLLILKQHKVAVLKEAQRLEGISNEAN